MAKAALAALNGWRGGPGFRAFERLLDLAPQVLNRVEVRRIRRPVLPPRAGGFNGLPHPHHLVRGQVVPDDHVVTLPAGHQPLLAPRPETARRPWLPQRAPGPAAPVAARRRSSWWSDNAPAARVRLGAGRPDCARSAGSSGCWLRFHPRTPAGGRPRPPAVAATAAFVQPQVKGRGGAIELRAQFRQRGVRRSRPPPLQAGLAGLRSGGACGRSGGFAAPACHGS